MAQLIYAAVVLLHKLHFMPMITEKRGFSNAALIFPTGDQISVVQHQDLHCMVGPAGCWKKRIVADSPARSRSAMGPEYHTQISGHRWMAACAFNWRGSSNGC
jgi:hypothetical protein